MAEWMEKPMKVFIKECLIPQLWPGAVVVMDNVPAHKIASIETLIQSAGEAHFKLVPLFTRF